MKQNNPSMNNNMMAVLNFKDQFFHFMDVKHYVSGYPLDYSKFV